MKKRTICTLIATVLCLSTGMTALAAPETMPDGGVFDAEYYAETYLDVVAAFGTDSTLLYQHYINFGQKEGRLPYDPAQLQTANITEQSDSLIEPGDENYLRVNYISAFCDYHYDGEEMAFWHPDPAKSLVRQDMRSDPYYQAIRNEVIAYMETHPDAKWGKYYSNYIYNPRTWDTEKHYYQVRQNLAIDLVKEGIVKCCYFIENPADGIGLASTNDYDRVTIGYLNYCINENALKRHPELVGYYDNLESLMIKD